MRTQRLQDATLKGTGMTDVIDRKHEVDTVDTPRT